MLMLKVRQCPWVLLTVLGFLMFLCHPQPFLLPAEEIRQRAGLAGCESKVP